MHDYSIIEHRSCHSTNSLIKNTVWLGFVDAMVAGEPEKVVWRIPNVVYSSVKL